MNRQEFLLQCNLVSMPCQNDSGKILDPCLSKRMLHKEMHGEALKSDKESLKKALKLGTFFTCSCGLEILSL